MQFRSRAKKLKQIDLINRVPQELLEPEKDLSLQTPRGQRCEHAWTQLGGMSAVFYESGLPYMMKAESSVLLYLKMPEQREVAWEDEG